MSPRARSGLLGVAFLGSGVHAASFWLFDPPGRLAWLMLGVQVAAASSWPVLGALLVWLDPATCGDGGWRGRATRWFDVCLRVIAFGEIWLVTGAALNAIALMVPGLRASWTAYAGVQCGLIGLAGLTMLWRFVIESRRLKLPMGRALGAWVLGLNGTFAVVFWLLASALGGGLR